jgi:hypothetical protein
MPSTPTPKLTQRDKKLEAIPMIVVTTNLLREVEFVDECFFDKYRNFL